MIVFRARLGPPALLFASSDPQGNNGKVDGQYYMGLGFRL